MKNLIVTLVLLAATAFAHAQPTLDVSKLTPAQVQQLAAQAETMSQSSTGNISKTVRDEAAAWADLGANIGLALVSAAKEVGVAANEFSETSLGKIVVFIVVYKVVGQAIIGIVVGFGILIFGYSLAIWLLTTKRWSDIKYEYDAPMFFGLIRRKRIVEISTDESVQVTKSVFGGILLVLTTIVGLSIIL